MPEHDTNECARRWDALEARMSHNEHETAKARDFAAMADRDVADVKTELRAHNQVLHALRETQLEQGRTLTEHGRVLGGLVTQVDGLERRFDGLENRFDGLENRFDGLEGKVDAFVTEQRKSNATLVQLMATLVGKNPNAS